MAFARNVRLHAAQQLTRHLRSPAIWVLALAGPLAARFMVPEPGSGSSMLGVNDASLALTASTIGLQLGVITAVLLGPLAYIFLKAGPTRIQPRQVTDALPRSRPALSLGQWLGDVAALSLLVLVLAVAGVVLSLFRIPLGEVSPLETLAATLIVAAPALAVIAGVRTLFAMRPRLRGALGDVAFFFIWMGALVASAAFFMDGSGGSPFADMFGFAAPLLKGTSEPVTALYIGGAPGTDRLIEVDGLAGVLDPAYLLSRLFWIGVAAGVVLLGGLLFSPGKPKTTKGKAVMSREPATFATEPVHPVEPTGHGSIAQLRTDLTELFHPLWLWGLIGLVALAGTVLPLRGLVGPALVLMLIFPMTQYGARWRAPSVAQWQASLPVSTVQTLGLRLLAAILAACLTLVPSLISLPAAHWTDLLAIGVGLPLLAVGLGYVTRGPVAARLLLLILWYGYLNLGPPAL
ncbi:MAG: hypothetical protein WBF53_08810 [Litorimonas sp.]